MQDQLKASRDMDHVKTSHDSRILDGLHKIPHAPKRGKLPAEAGIPRDWPTRINSSLVCEFRSELKPN